MVKECTPQFVKELEDKAKEGKIEKLIITKRAASLENKKDIYIAEYSLVEDDKDTELQMSDRLYVSYTLRDFGLMLSLDKVNDFSIHYVPKEKTCVVSFSYKVDPTEISNLEKLNKAKEDLVNSLFLLDEIGSSKITVKDVYVRCNKNTLDTTVPNQKQNPGKIKYKEATISEIVEKILEATK